MFEKNKALDAFDKELLADFTKYIGDDILDQRLKAWEELDNLGADLLFKKKILKPLVKINKEYAYDVNMQAFNPIRVIGVLDKIELNDDIKEMLLHVRGHGAACGIYGEEIINHYEKEKMLMKICEFLSFEKRKLKQHEKVFFFNYLREAVIDGFDPTNIGLNDDVVSKLVANDDKENLSEIEISKLVQHNNDLIEFAMTIDKNDGFYEKAAVKMMDFDPSLFQMLYDRCMALMNSPYPKGVIFALELVNKNKIKSAVKILIELSKHGKATEMAAFMHRLLPCVKGAETMIMSILRFNLMQLKVDDKYSNKSVLGEYVARVYLIAIKCFVDAGLLKEATNLIIEIVKGGWVIDEYLEDEYGRVINDVVLKNGSYANALIPWSNVLNLKVYKYKDKVLLGRNKNDLLLRDVRSLDGRDIIKDNADENKYREVVSSQETNNSIELDNEKQENISDIENIIINDNDDDTKGADEEKNDEVQVLEDNDENYSENEEIIVGDIGEDIVDIERNNNSIGIEKEEISKKLVDEVKECIVDEVSENNIIDDSVVIVNDENGTDVSEDDIQIEVGITSVDNNDNIENKDEVKEISVNYEIDEKSGEEKNVRKLGGLNERIDNVINKWKEIDFTSLNDSKNNMLKFNIKDLDKHFERVKHIAGNVVDKAEDVSNQIKENVKNSNLSELKSVSTIKELAKKIKFKKGE